MTEQHTDEEGRIFQARWTEVVIRIALLAFLFFLCIRVAHPFINPIIGGIVIAIAFNGPYERVTKVVGGRRALGAVILFGAILLALLLPTIALGINLVETAADLSQNFDPDEITVPPPPEAVADWPIVGDRVPDLWLAASRNHEAGLL